MTVATRTNNVTVAIRHGRGWFCFYTLYCRHCTWTSHRYLRCTTVMTIGNWHAIAHLAERTAP